MPSKHNREMRSRAWHEIKEPRFKRLKWAGFRKIRFAIKDRIKKENDSTRLTVSSWSEIEAEKKRQGRISMIARAHMKSLGK